MRDPPARHRSAAPLGFAAYGACALIAQLVILQELLIVFAGHELFLGFSLASWMAWVGAGSWLARRASHANLPRLIAWLIPCLIANVLAIRLSRLLFGFGMLIGLLPMLLLTSVLLAPAGLAAGACFTWGCAWAAERHRLPIGAAYLWETAGAAVGGLAFSSLIAGRFSTEWVIALLSGPVALAALWLVPRRPLAVASAVVTALLAAGWAVSPLPRITRAAQWRGYQLLAERASRYSHLVLAKTGGLTGLFENGVLSAHFPDPAAYEELVHWPLLAHPAPRRVLVLGTAATGTLAELLRHPVTAVDAVELDPAVIELLRPALDPVDRAALQDARVRLVHQDGRRWLQQADGRYDVILLQLPEPRNAQINRLYTLEAFRAVGRRLAPGGLFAFTIPSSENYLSPETAYFSACLFRTLQAAFPSVELIAGDPLLLMAGRGPVSLDVAALRARHHERRLRTREVVPGYLSLKLDPERRLALLAQLRAAGAVPLNRDFFPACYAYAWRVWLAKFVSPLYFLGALLLLALAARLLRAAWRRRAALLGDPGAASLALLGAAGMVEETVLLLAFQSISGYIYWQLGTLFAAFMLGLAAGSGLLLPRLPGLDARRARRGLRLLIASAGVEGLALPWLLPRIQSLAPILPPLMAVGALLFLTACWLGAAFPLASRAAPAQAAGRTAGRLYAADLWGASAGALVTSSALIPLIGLTATAGMVGLLLVIAAAAMAPRAHPG